MRPHEIDAVEPVSPRRRSAAPGRASGGERRISAVSSVARAVAGLMGWPPAGRADSASRSAATRSFALVALPQRVGDARRPQEARDARERLKVERRCLRRREDQEEQGDAAPRPRRRNRRPAGRRRSRGTRSSRSFTLAMRDRDPRAETRAAETLPLEQPPGQVLRVRGHSRARRSGWTSPRAPLRSDAGAKPVKTSLGSTRP